MTKTLAFFISHCLGYLSVVFGIFPAKYFTAMSLVYGFIGAAFYSVMLVLIRIQQIIDDGELAKPIHKLEWVLFIMRPFAAGLLSFILTAILKAVVINPFVNPEIEKSQALGIVLGLGSGLLFEFIATREFFKKIFKSKVEDKL